MEGVSSCPLTRTRSKASVVLKKTSRVSRNGPAFFERMMLASFDSLSGEERVIVGAIDGPGERTLSVEWG